MGLVYLVVWDIFSKLKKFLEIMFTGWLYPATLLMSVMLTKSKFAFPVSSGFKKRDNDIWSLFYLLKITYNIMFDTIKR